MKPVIPLLALLLCAGNSAIAQAPFNTPDNIGAGNCLEFDGVDDYVDCGDFDITGAITVSAWIRKIIAGGGDESIISKHSPAEKSWIFRVASGDNNDIQFAVYANNGTIFRQEASNTDALNSNLWTHVSATYSPATGDIQLFINGIEQTTIINNNGAPTGPTANNQPVDIGRRFCSGGDCAYFNGQIDEVRIWNIARTQAQIRDDMCRSIDNTHPQWANLVGYWPMNEGADNTCAGGEDVCDQSGNGNHGTLEP